MRSMKKSIRGVTLLELMITVAVLAILLSVAMPGMQTLMETSSLKSSGDMFARAITYARTEAASQHEEIIVCPSTDQATCSGSKEYDVGLIVFSDKNSNGVLDGGTCSLNDDCLLRYIEPMGNKYTLRPAGAASNQVVFSNLGEFQTGDKEFYLCAPSAKSSNDTESSYTLKISGSGSMGLVKGSKSCP